jgi:hypothetical protein
MCNVTEGYEFEFEGGFYKKYQVYSLAKTITTYVAFEISQ